MDIALILEVLRPGGRAEVHYQRTLEQKRPSPNSPSPHLGAPRGVLGRSRLGERAIPCVCFGCLVALPAKGAARPAALMGTLYASGRVPRNRMGT